MTLSEKYRPKSFEEIKGKEIEVERVKSFIKNFPKKKAIILHGPAGTGKTSLAFALASDTNSEIIELNASDLRNREQVSKIIGEASKQASLFEKKGKILLIDEVDGINYQDRGGLSELISLIKESKFPIIITANNIWDKKFSSLRRIADLIEMKELNYEIILEILNTIAKKENLQFQPDLLKSIASKSKGDIRAAINDLQTINLETQQEHIHERDKGENIFNILKAILKNLPDDQTITAYNNTELHLDEILLWLEENVPREYKGDELYKAFEAISKADVFRGRIYKQQYWRFLVYQNFFLSAGISAAKKQVKVGFTSYKKPSRILKIWLMNQKTKHKKTIAEKYAAYCHINKKRAMKEFPIIRHLLKNPAIRQELELTEEENSFLEK